jgi:peptide/nickel transport system ATP-binding protein
VQKLAAESGTALVWITHDLSVVAGLADRVAVMYAGRVVETGNVGDIIDSPMHPYTAGLIASVPSRNRRGEPLRQIPGATPSLRNMPSGCPFHPRCARSTEVCVAAFPEPRAFGEREVKCYHPLDEVAVPLSVERA